MTRIMDIIEHPDEATRYGEAINVSVVHAVETYEGEVVYVEGMPTDPTQDHYYIITDTREVWTRCEYREGESGFWGYPGARITYEMWIMPGTPTSESEESPTGGSGTSSGDTGGGSGPDSGDTDEDGGGGPTP